MHAHLRGCLCGKSSGEYIDNTHAVIRGPCVPLGFGNLSFREALTYQPEEGAGATFTAFVIPKEVAHIRHEQ